MKIKQIEIIEWDEREEKQSIGKWIWDHLPYWFTNRYIRIKRAINWMILIYKQPSWQEYESLISILRKRLLDMAEEFERTNITMSSQYDASRMRLCAELLRRFLNEYYWKKYFDESQDPQKKKQARTILDKDPDDFDSFLNFNTYKDGYDYTHTIKGYQKDQQALNIACNILKQMNGWW